MRGRSCRALLITLTVAVGCALTPAAQAAKPITESFTRSDDGTCPTYGDLEICSGQVESFDGSPLDVDLTKPLNDNGAKRHPLIVMLHGFGNNKHEWESLRDEGDGGDKFHWNSHWFAKHGYYVLTYTARGFCHDGNFRQACAKNRPDQPDTPPFRSARLPSGTIQLKSRDAEIKDTQYLAALVAKAFPEVDPSRVAVTGGSYGGGESWVQASQSRWTFPNRIDPSLPVLDLQVAVPKYPWTDLAYSLAPNGHPRPASRRAFPEPDDQDELPSSDGPLSQPVGPPVSCAPAGQPDEGDNPLYESSQGCAESDTGDGNPIGTLKESYVTGFFAIGQLRGIFEKGTRTPPTQTPEGPINIEAWNARALAGDPYDVAGAEDPVVRQIRRGLTEFRSAYYQDEGWNAQRDGRKVGIFAIQGWTDDLFPAVEAFRQFKYLKRLDPRWPVEVELADVGHSRGQNKPQTWQRLNAQAFQFLESHINGSHEQETHISSQPTICANDGEPDRNDLAAQRLTAQSPEGLSRGKLMVAYDRGQAINAAAGAADPNGPATDPVFGGVFDPIIGPSAGCRESPGPAVGGYTAYSQPLPSRRTYIGLGSVHVPYVLTGANTATLHARVWDDPPGPARPILMSRGTYRIDTPAYDTTAGRLELPLFGNHWPLKPGHRIRLDLTLVDQPFLRPSNEAEGIVKFEPPTLELPTRQSGEETLAGT